MPTLDRPDPVILEHVLAEHRELFQLISQTLAAFNNTGNGDRPLGKRREYARSRIGLLRSHLQAHFAQEESGGFLEEAVSRIPRLGRRMEEILREHPALVTELDSLVAALARSRLSEAGWQQARRQFQAFVGHLQAHERSEHAVLQEGYNEDLGLVDDKPRDPQQHITPHPDRPRHPR